MRDNPDVSFPYCFAWAKTDAFELASAEYGRDNRGVIGQEIRFDIVEYPMQETTDPDPVAALNSFLAEEYPEAMLAWLPDYSGAGLTCQASTLLLRIVPPSLWRPIMTSQRPKQSVMASPWYTGASRWNRTPMST